MESKCEEGEKRELVFIQRCSVFPGCSIQRLNITKFPFVLPLKLLESPRSNWNGSVMFGFPLRIPVQLIVLSENRIWFLIHFTCLLLAYFTNFLITLMPRKFLCFGQKIKNVMLLYLVLVFSLHLLLNQALTLLHIICLCSLHSCNRITV